MTRRNPKRIRETSRNETAPNRRSRKPNSDNWNQFRRYTQGTRTNRRSRIAKREPKEGSEAIFEVPKPSDKNCSANSNSRRRRELTHKDPRGSKEGQGNRSEADHLQNRGEPLAKFLFSPTVLNLQVLITTAKRKTNSRRREIRDTIREKVWRKTSTKRQQEE